MGFAKYHEDNLRIYDERMYYRRATTLPGVLPEYTRRTLKIEYKLYCPFCHSGVVSHTDLIKHVLNSHGGSHEFVYLNNRKVRDAETSVRQVFSLKLYSFREEAREIQLLDSIGNAYSFWTQRENYEYDLHSILKAQPFSEIRITNIDGPVCIKQQLDIGIVSVDKIISGKYPSCLFDEQFSEGKLSAEGCLIYIKMLLNEGTETESFIECIDQMHLDQSRELQEIYYYHFLGTASSVGIEGKIPSELAAALLLLLDGKYQNSEKVLLGMKGRSNDQIGCQLICSLLRNDTLSVDFLAEKYNPYGIIGVLEKVLYHFSHYEKETPDLLIKEFEELKLLQQYPLIHALVELNRAINRECTLSHGSYSLLRNLTPLAAIHYCYGIDDCSVKEKILKSMVKTHKDSALIKEYAFQNEYSWMKRRIFVSDGVLYRKAVVQQNEELGGVFSSRYIEEFPFDDQIRITPLGGEHDIGASCFVISYKGYNIMLDCGINPQKYGDAAYPALDTWGKDIDAIVISHAHIDHSGGVPKAHAMWPNANIIATAPTKVFLKYLYSDMAKVKNGIADEFEIENIKIEKDTMIDALMAINTVGYGDWVCLDEGMKVRLHPAGHIVGAAMIELMIAGKTLLYTGDYCNFSQVLAGSLDLTMLPNSVDYLITEATYLKKERVNWKQQYSDLKGALLKAIHSGMSVLLPAAAAGRSQELVCIIGEMKLSGEIPSDVLLYIAGMAIPTTTQISPFMNERYEEIIGEFEEFDGQSYPEDRAIVVASSGSMSKGSASYKIAKYWDNQKTRYTILASGYLDEDFETDSGYMDGLGNVQRFSLSTHADIKGMFDLIDYVSPRAISFVHRGFGTEDDIRQLEKRCKLQFSNDILLHNLRAEQCSIVFDMYKYLIEGEC